MMNRQSIGFVGALLLFATAGEQAEQVQDRFRDLTPYEVYQEGLSNAGLSETALGRDWLTTRKPTS